MNEDFRDLLAGLLDAEARFLVVGAHAMAVHGVPRATGDLAVWIRPDPANAQAWARRTMHAVDQREAAFLGREDLIRNKRASGRAKDLADPDVLEDGGGV